MLIWNLQKSLQYRQYVFSDPELQDHPWDHLCICVEQKESILEIAAVFGVIEGLTINRQNRISKLIRGTGPVVDIGCLELDAFLSFHFRHCVKH